MPCMMNAILVPGKVMGTICGQISRQMYVAPDELIKAMHMNDIKAVMTVGINIEKLTVLCVTKCFFLLISSSWKTPRVAKLTG